MTHFRDVPPRCLVCESAAARLLYRLPHISVVRCDACDQIYLHPLPTEADIQTLFSGLYANGDGGMPELQGYYGFCFDDRPDNPLVQLYESWLDALERHRPPGRLLDVGCGTGLFLVVARRRGWRPVGVDDCAEAARHAIETFGCDVRIGDVESLELDERFDAITMWDVLEHSRRPVNLLRTLRGALAPGGVLGVACPNQRNLMDVVARALYRVSGGHITSPLEKFYFHQHFLYFTPDTLRQGLRRAGFEALELRLQSTDLRRLNLSAVTRTGLRMLFQLARWTSLENRVFAIARSVELAEPSLSVDS